jgi:hypothetical protein
MADLRAELIAMARSVKATHESVAATMDRLADLGGEHAARRREIAERARGFAALEARHIDALLGELNREIELH